MNSTNTTTAQLPLPLHPELERRFTYHAPREGQPALYQRIRDQAKELALLVASACPNNREHALAITKIEEAVFWANASIARN